MWTPRCCLQALSVCVAVVSLALAQGEWAAIKSDSGKADGKARSKYVEFELDAKAAVRFRWEVTVNEGRTKPYFRLKLERWAPRNRDGVWQNVGPICTVHKNDKGAATMNLPPAKYRATIYYEDLSYQVAIEKQ